MVKVNSNLKTNLNCGKSNHDFLKYPWNATIYTGLIGQSINSVLSLINQFIYNNNPNPLYKSSTRYDDSSSKLYVRMSKNALSSTMSIGNPWI